MVKNITSNLKSTHVSPKAEMDLKWKLGEIKGLDPYCLSDSAVVDKDGLNNLKKSADFCRNVDIKRIVKGGRAPAPLIIQNMDRELIYEQMLIIRKSQLNPTIPHIQKFIHLGDDGEEEANSSASRKSEDEVVNGENDEESDRKKVIEKTEETAQNRDDRAEESDEEIDDESDESEDEELLEESEEEVEQVHKPKSEKKSIVDDDFFKLDEMEQFLNAQEKKDEVPDSGNESENSEEFEEKVDLFEDLPDEDTTAELIRYKDFFVQKDDPNVKKRKRNKLMEELDEEGSDEDEPRLKKSTFEQRQERLTQRIEQIEKGAVSEKPWQLKGEISAKDRPQNSLMEEFVDFDVCTRPAPVQTEQTTLKLEDLVKQRIRDKNFDDPIRKAKPVETPLEYKKKLVLDQEKSKESLAQIYENEYLKQKESLDPDNADKEEVEPELHKEINTLLNSLFYKLDSLSNFHSTPAPVRPEAKIVNNAPAISMEEVAPVATSDATLLAPEEVKRRPKGDVIGTDERTSTDKKRARRRKKKKQQIHARRQQKLEEGGKSKISVDKVTKHKNVDKMEQSAGKMKSSTAFFTELEDVMKVGGKVGEKKKKQKTQNAQAKKYKL